MTAPALISCEHLLKTLAADKQVIFDATFFLPRQRRNAYTEYREAHLPGALFFDIDGIADSDNPLPHSLPSAKRFAEAVGKLGVDNDTRVILYDNNHFFAAARAWWMFRVFGHDNVKILDGGLSRWLQFALPINSTPAPTTEKYFDPGNYRDHLVCDLDGMRQIQQSGSHQILDARSPDSFLGQRPLNDPELAAGHIPGSINIPYAGLTDPQQQTLLPNNELRTLFAEADVDLTKPIVTTCGSGVSAAMLVLALYQLGETSIPMYDGSWAEWGRQLDTPKHKMV